MSRIHSMHRVVYWSAGALFCLSCAPHFAPAIARRGHHRYELPGSVVPQELVDHVQKIAAAMGLPHPERVRVFTNNGFSSVSAGTTLLPGGAVIGLPRTMLFRDEDDVKTSGITVEGEEMDWESEEGKKLMQLLVPTAQQINFSIAHEVAHLNHLDFLYHIFLAPTFLVLGYHASKIIPKYAFPRYTVAAFPLLMALCIVAFAQTSAAISRWQEHRADHTAALCRRSYCHGGIETMKKRMHIDSIFSPYSSSSFFGTVASSLNSHPPFAERLERLENLLTLLGEKQ